MKQFFGAFFGSILGILISSIVVLLVAVFLVKSTFSAALKEQEGFAEPAANSVLKLDLGGVLSERENENYKMLSELGSFVGEQHAVGGLVRKIRFAAGDDRIKGIYLRIKKLEGGFASFQELRDAIVFFRKSGKFTCAYAEDLSAREYFLASACEKVYLHPLGMLEWHGLSMNLLFFKQMLEKLDIELQLFRHGRYKSAVEPLMLDKMSESNRLQSRAFLGSIWNSMVNAIAVSRKIPSDSLNLMAEKLRLGNAKAAMRSGLLDGVVYEDEVNSMIKKKLGITDKEKLKFSEEEKYEGRPKPDIKLRAKRIAVIYASGSIGSGEGGDDEIGSEKMARVIREARLDSKIKGIVLRVNSPGGSALASDVIWREMVLAGKEKPVVVSMGDLAASGGYYISCGAHRIFAQPNTITGSIGVFGIIPNFGKLLEKKLGITHDTVKTNRHSDIISGVRSVDQEEIAYVQNSVEDIYATFIQHVSDGRKMGTAMVDSIGQGRVWTGSDAKRIGLVDELGGLQDALAWVAKKAGLKEYRVEELPRQKGLLDGFLKMKEEETTKVFMSKLSGPLAGYYTSLKSMLAGNRVQARLPFEFKIN